MIFEKTSRSAVFIEIQYYIFENKIKSTYKTQEFSTIMTHYVNEVFPCVNTLS